MNATGHIKLVERKKGPVWYARYRLPSGKHVQKKLGPAWTQRSGRPTAGYLTKGMAEARLREILTDAGRGILSETNASGATFQDAADEYLRYVEKIRQIDPTTLKDYRGVVNGYLLPKFGNKPLEAITPDDIDAYKEDLIAEDRLTNRTIVRHLNVLHGIFKRAMRKWKLNSNPASAELVERPSVNYTDEFETYDREEIDLLAANALNAQEGTLYKVAAFTGLRQGELLALRWENVDFIGGMVHVRRNYTDRTEKIPKGKKVRSVPMMPEVIDLLGKLKERDNFTQDSDLVFCDEIGDHLNSWSLRRRYYQAIENAGLRRLRFHDLRHAFGSAAITRLDPYAVQSYMGHQHYSTTQRYLHHRPRRQDAAALAEAFAPEEKVSQEVSRTPENQHN